MNETAAITATIGGGLAILAQAVPVEGLGALGELVKAGGLSGAGLIGYVLLWKWKESVAEDNEALRAMNRAKDEEIKALTKEYFENVVESVATLKQSVESLRVESRTRRDESPPHPGRDA